MNNVTLSGHLTHEPKLLHQGERPICEMRLVVDNGRRGPTYIDVPTFDSQAYVCAEYLHKGSMVGVSGRLIHREWRAADGSKRERYSVIGWVEFLDRPSSGGADRSSEPEPTELQLNLAG